ncbi:MAG: hypothetical protein WAW86_04775 [Gammaproteobacteria bacterium]
MTYLMFARWFGLVSVLLSLGILFNLEDAREMAKNMVKSETGYIMGGVLPIIFGSLSLLFLSDFEGWDLVITAVGTAMLLAGMYRVFFVQHWKATISRHIEQIPFLFSLFGLMLGVILLYVGFIAKSFEVVGA